MSEGTHSRAGRCSGRGRAGGGKHSGADAHTAGAARVLHLEASHMSLRWIVIQGCVVWRLLCLLFLLIRVGLWVQFRDGAILFSLFT